MKYIIILGDGMADEPRQELGGKTPLEYARTPALDALAPLSELGMAHTIPEGMAPGSDTANLAVLGYDPKKYYTGRSPLEALSIGVDLGEDDVALRTNLVTVTEKEGVPYEKQTMVDHSAGEISTEDAAILLGAVKESLEKEGFRFYTGTSYRHLLIWKKGKTLALRGPHDILEQEIGAYLPAEAELRYMQERSYEILREHPLNLERKKRGENPANSIWFWGAGTRPSLTSFGELRGKRGAMISAVDLLKGIAMGAGMKNIEVEGANGQLHTNYEGKADAACRALLEEGFDFVYVHVEAPDEMGHQGSTERKVQAIEYLDQRVIRRVREQLDASGEPYRMLVMPDHPTPIRVRTHTADPVPYLLYDSTHPLERDWVYNEAQAEKSGILLQEGFRLIERLFEKPGL
ncbi:MAG: cofactor-independent phosphoglycerate mutase [Lachnospiraceae bacterium]|jgi:2,3-bisphosphoglycerate-independent phosphoglycerate mutase|nr:cofactor-independent phosphoglycerate mutase [Lachnospiraceae bacterium]